MTSEDIIIQQKQLVELQLTPLIDNDYYLLDVPYYSNIGDTLIWKGTLDFLGRLPYKCLGMHSFQTFEFGEIDEHVVLILLGGGNFGDLYIQHQQFRKQVIKAYPNNKIIMLPQTVYYYGAGAIREDSRVFRKHKNLYLCARDNYSYKFLRRYHFSDRILLLPDMAFCIDINALVSLSLPQTKKTLIFQRIDKEKTELGDIAETLNGSYEISDWPGYKAKDPILEKVKELINSSNHRTADQIAIEDYLPERLKVGVELISSYQKVYSNRLHGAILSILLGKDVSIIDNKYGKNIQYYDTWLKGTSNVSVVKIHHSFNLKRFMKFQIVLLLTYYDRLLKC